MNTRSKSALTLLLLVAVAAVLTVMLWPRTEPAATPEQDVVTEQPIPEQQPFRPDGAVAREAIESKQIPKDSSPVASSVTVLVRDASSLSPIEGALVVASGSKVEVSTNSLGQAGLPGISPPADVAVSADGYANTVVEIESHNSDPVLIDLTQEAVIQGWVFASDRGPLPDGADAFAWPKDQTPSVQDIEESRSGFPRVLRVDVNEDRSFEIRGAAKGQDYDVAAGAPGWTVEEVVRFNGNDAVTVGIRPVFGCVVRAKMPGDRIPPLVPGGSWRVFQTSARDDVEREFYPSSRLALAGLYEVPEAKLGRKYDWRAILATFSARNRSEALQAIRVQYNIPGFDDPVADIAIPALTEDLAVREVVLSPVAMGFGSLEIVFDGAIEGLPEGGGPPTLHLQLQSMTAGGRSLRLAVFGPLSGVNLVEGLPFGEYKAVLGNKLGPSLLPIEGGSNNISIRGGEPAQYVVDCSRLGAVQLRNGMFGGAARGSLSVELIPRETRGRAKLSTVLHSNPVLLPGLASGVYDIQVEFKSGGVTRSGTVSALTVVSGEVAEADLDWSGGG